MLFLGPGPTKVIILGVGSVSFDVIRRTFFVSPTFLHSLLYVAIEIGIYVSLSGEWSYPALNCSQSTHTTFHLFPSFSTGVWRLWGVMPS